MTPQEALQKAINEYEEVRAEVVRIHGWLAVPTHLYMVLAGAGGLVIGFIMGLMF